MSISGGSITEATISELTPSTAYSIEVAAVNSADIGVYNSPIIAETHNTSKYTCHTGDVSNLYIFCRCISQSE